MGMVYAPPPTSAGVDSHGRRVHPGCSSSTHRPEEPESSTRHWAMSLFGADSDSMDGMTSTASTWDVRPLTEALTPDQVRQWRRTHREVKSGDPTSMWALLIVAPILIVGVLVASSTWTSALQGGTTSRPVFGLLVPL